MSTIELMPLDKRFCTILLYKTCCNNIKAIMSKKLPKEAVAFAKSMGLDLNGLEVEAQV